MENIESGFNNSRLESVEDFPDKVAREKLEKILGDDFKDFAVRFISLDEYKYAIEAGGFSGKEVFFFDPINQKIETPNFKEYLERSGSNWSRVALRQTDWKFSTVSLDVYEFLLKSLRESHEQIVSEKKGDNFGLTKEVLELFRNKVLDYIKKNDEKLSNNHIGLLKALRYHPDPQQNNLDRDELEIWSEEKMSTIYDFMNDKEFLNTKGNLRKLIDAMSTLRSLDGEDVRPYQLAIILDLEALMINKMNGTRGFAGSDWGNIGAKQGLNLLAVIDVLPNKSILEEVIEISSSSGEMSCPVFDSKGNVKWPK